MNIGRLMAFLLLAMATCPMVRAASAGPEGQPLGPWREQIHWVPVRDAGGNEHLLYTRICRPQGDAPAPVVVINHGDPPDSMARPGMQPLICSGEVAQWFLQRGFVVVAGMRRGFGATGGDFAEGYHTCTAGNYARAGLESARDVAAWVSYATALPFAHPDGAVVVGQSGGGWATVAYDSQPHPQVVAMISMAGGRGGHWHRQANNNCRPDELARAAGIYGASATTPMLWVYAANDSFFAPTIATSLHQAFTAAGGKAALIQPGPFGRDGHALFFGVGGSGTWGPMVERYLAERGVSVR